MIIIRKKISSLIVMISLTVLHTFAQSSSFKCAYGFGVGLNMSYTDVYKSKIGYTTSGVFDIQVFPSILFGIEGQFGMVQGGDINSDPHNRQFTNKYFSYTANGKILIGEFFNSDFLKGFYVGAGVGLIHNNITQVVRYKPNTELTYPPLGYKFPGQDKSINIAVPTNLGYIFYFRDDYNQIKYAIHANAQLNFTFGEGLDGYNDPEGKFKNTKADQYVVYSVGIKYFFGRLR